MMAIASTIDPTGNGTTLSSPAIRLARFVRFLRREGFNVGVQEALDSLRIADGCGALDERFLREGLRSLLCMSRDDWSRFDLLFDYFWFPERLEHLEQTAAKKRDPRMPQSRSGGHTGLSHVVEADLLADEMKSGSERGRGGAGRQNALARSDFRFLTDHREMREMERLAERLAKRLRRRLTRRYRDLNWGRKIHMRRTIRKSLGYGGLPLVLTYRERRRQLPRFVLLLDVSHSMAHYSYLLARFVRGIVLTFPDAEAFVFHTRLYRVTDLFRQTESEVLRKRLEGMTQLWFGGTRIADSLKNFNHLFGRRIINSRSTVVIMSDGFDTDAPELLTEELRALRGRARKILWLNPMLEREGYTPDDGAMLAALPMLDLLAPAHNVASLEAVESYLATL